jgi:hypothetical protein
MHIKLQYENQKGSDHITDLIVPESNTKMDLKVMGSKDVDWVKLYVVKV